MRSIEELLKMNKYDGLSHEEVMLLIDQKVLIAKNEAYMDYLASDICKHNQALAQQQRELYNQSLEQIKQCKLDFKPVSIKTGEKNE